MLQQTSVSRMALSKWKCFSFKYKMFVELYSGVYIHLSIPGFGTSDEAEAIEELLQAYDQSDAEQMKTIVKKPLFRNLDNEVCSVLYLLLCLLRFL